MNIVHSVWTLIVLDVNITMYISETLKRIDMVTIKSYTDLQQSRTLAKILPIQSADGGWYGTDNPLAANTEYWLYTKYTVKAALPTWSLAALLSVIPNYKLNSEHNYHTCTSETNFGKESVGWYDNPVDACYEMILKLHELKML